VRRRGEVVTIVGANGAGKSTLLKAISGVVKTSHGTITFAGERIDKLGVEGIVNRRVIQIPEGRQLFGPLSVEENLLLGTYSAEGETGRSRPGWSTSAACSRGCERDSATSRDPVRRRTADAGRGSSPYGRARLLLLDEPSMGLAPLVVREIFATLRTLNEQGLTMVLVEQDARIALSLAHRGWSWKGDA